MSGGDDGGGEDLPTWAADLLGLEVGAAEARVRAAGLAVRLAVTAPPWLGEGSGPARVVRVRAVAVGILELTAAREGFARRGRPGRPAVGRDQGGQERPAGTSGQAAVGGENRGGA